MAPNELKRLLPRHYEILRLCLQGFRRNDIALALKPPMTPEGVGLIINSPLFQDELARQREGQLKKDMDIRTENTLEAMDILQEAAKSAAQKHVDLLNSESERTAQASANAILDRVLKAKEDGNVTVKLDKSIIALLQITLQEIKDVVPNSPPIERLDAFIE